MAHGKVFAVKTSMDSCKLMSQVVAKPKEERKKKQQQGDDRFITLLVHMVTIPGQQPII